MHFKTQPLLFVLLLILLISVPGFAQQSVKDAKVTIKARDASLIEVLEEIERQTGFTFFYKTTAETESPVNLEFTNTSLEKVLYELSRRSKLVFQRNNNQIIMTPKKLPESQMARPTGFGKVTGKVIDGVAGEPLIGALVKLKNTSLGAVTDLSGRYLITGVPAGDDVVLVASYLGYEDIASKVQVSAGQTTIANFELPVSSILTEAVIITGTLEGQAKALNQQQNADNIKNVISSDLIGRFPDLNVAEALQRVPGVTINRRRGEGSTVQIRGTQPNFTTISINGEQIPSVETGGTRNESLDLIPADVISSMEVSKAITPDMDGDAVGGAINLRSPIAKYLQPSIKVEGGLGYNNMSRGLNGIGRLSYGQRFLPTEQHAEGRLGFKIGGSYFGSDNTQDIAQSTFLIVDDIDLLSNQFATSLEGRRLLEEFRYMDFFSERVRIGANATVDYKLGSNSDIRANLIYSRRDESDNRRRARYDMKLDGTSFYTTENVSENARIRRDITLQEITKENYTANIDANIQLGQSNLDIGAFYTFSQRDGETDYLAFRRRLIDINYDNSDPEFPEFTLIGSNSSIYDPLLLNAIDRLEDNTFRNEARNYVGRFNYQIPLKVGESTGYFKTGAKYRNIRNTRTRDSQVFTYDRTRQRDFPTPQEQIYATLVDDFEDNRFMVGEARFGRGLNENKVRDFTAESLALGVWNPEGDQTSISELSHFYIADEQVYAGYGMGKLNIGKLMILAGARYERTTIDYDAWQLEINGEDLDDSTRVSVDRAFDFLLPNVHFKLSPDRSTNFRAAATFSYGRPNFIDLSPVVTIRETDGEIRKGNIDLVPSRAFNLDLMYERFLPDVGIISVGLFSKHIQNFVATRTVRIDSSNYQNFIDFNPFANRPQYTLIQKENGDQGVVFGVELNLQTQLTFLSPFLRNFGIYANYTFADSEAFVNEFDPSSGTETTRRVDLPDQARHFGNFALTFDKGGFSGRVSVNYIGKVIIGYNGENSEFHDNSDQFRAGRYQLDISANYKLNKRFSVFTEFLNVTNQPIIEYQETRDYPIRVEYFGWWNRFGLSYRI